ncbi:unnamed protein product [Rotaria magnacalcarata]|uniref:Uncharacterized protein n=1 Tax=Rotaria magnacalcarata TaxID=392030 RepID=A0A819U7L7_9BILA|nr:unnamed protein product [Rotaria magnacalcarata]CAF4410998.1 unnamed protein product [Rotaria magnacalcarata]
MLMRIELVTISFANFYWLFSSEEMATIQKNISNIQNDIENNNQFHFGGENYFLLFVSNENNQENLIINPINKNIRHALENFLDDLRHDEIKTIENFLNQ